MYNAAASAVNRCVWQRRLQQHRSGRSSGDRCPRPETAPPPPSGPAAISRSDAVAARTPDAAAAEGRRLLVAARRLPPPSPAPPCADSPALPAIACACLAAHWATRTWMWWTPRRARRRAARARPSARCGAVGRRRLQPSGAAAAQWRGTLSATACSAVCTRGARFASVGRRLPEQRPPAACRHVPLLPASPTPAPTPLHPGSSAPRPAFLPTRTAWPTAACA